jgi:hypothetical protein
MRQKTSWHGIKAICIVSAMTFSVRRMAAFLRSVRRFLVHLLRTTPEPCMFGSLAMASEMSILSVNAR